MILAAFSSCCCYEFWLPRPPAAAEAFAAAAGPRMGKHHGSEGRRREKQPFRPLLLPAAAAVKQLRKNHLPGENTVPRKDELVPKPRQKSA